MNRKMRWLRSSGSRPKLVDVLSVEAEPVKRISPTPATATVSAASALNGKYARCLLNMRRKEDM